MLLALAACRGGSGSDDLVDPDADLLLTVDAAPFDDVSIPDATTPKAVPRAETTACRYDFPDLGLSEGFGYDCGDLTVYEDRNKRTRTIRLHYARIHSAAASDNATIYLAGGPGGNGGGILRFIAGVGASFLQGLLVDGDFLVIAQRGTSLSIPSLACEEGCGDLSAIADLSAYNTAFNADDVDELRATLGYDKLNLYGISYGSRLGLEVLRRHEGNVRSAVLGGLVPSQVVWAAGIAASFYSALTALNASCADAAGCEAAFGDLETKFRDGYESLNNEPLIFDYEGQEIYLDGPTYASVLFRYLYAKSSYSYLPMMISDIAEGRTDRINDFVAAAFRNSSSNISTGLYYSVVCGELFNPPSPTALEDANTDVPDDIRAMFEGSWYSTLETCETWPKHELQSALAQPVTSNVPSLVASGAMDPITPPSYGTITGAGLSKGTVVRYANSGHGATLQTACGNRNLLEFLANPEQPVDTSCALNIETDYILPSSIVGSTHSLKALQFELQQVPLPPDMHQRLRDAVNKTKN